MHAQPFCLDDGVQLDEGVGACSLKRVPANRQAVHEDSDTSLLGGFDVKANLYLYLYTCGDRCNCNRLTRAGVGLQAACRHADMQRMGRVAGTPNGHANPLQAQHHGSLGGFKVKANLYIYIYTHVAHDRCN